MIAIVDYGVGNLHSVYNALDLIRGGEAVVTKDPDEIRKADRIILPGVGAFGECTQSLRASGLLEALEEAATKQAKPLFGICVGLQLMAREGYELGTHQGLGWLPAVVKRFEVENQNLKVPHVGWNDVTFTKESPLFKGFKPNPSFYFVHSYHLVPDETGLTAATCDYGGPFTSAIIKNNIFATQFHPEKSQENGLKLLENFLAWNP